MKKQRNPLIVITGGAGFIGSCTVRYLNDLGIHDIVLVDELGQTEKWKNLTQKKYLDFIVKERLFDWLKGREAEIQAFIHLGACSDTMETDGSYLLVNNYRYSVLLAEYALKNNQRFIYASSAATYGDGNQGFSDQGSAFLNLEPLNMYGYSKQMFDQWAFLGGVSDQLIGLKYFNVFGPNENHKGRMASAITRMVPAILRGEPVKLFRSNDPSNYADGEQKRDFIYVKDAVRMTCAFLNEKAGGLYNVGSGEASSWNALTHAVFNALGHEPRIEYIEMPASLLNKYQNYSRADMRKTTEAIGENARCMPLEDAVKDYVQNYLALGKTW
ncbi:MAG: ADP-glyceromanno-heptose 6-epimerase [Parachlamydia sp.]|nr:ADP-glyceromanno-heptose 6-epimerase [Parachlamydia sp.]